MIQCLNTINTSVQWGVLKNKSRMFALLGKVTPFGLTAFGSPDIATGWALTAELGCLRLERLSGDEQVTGDHFFLPTPSNYEFGIIGSNDCPETTRAVFGLLPSELEQLLGVLRRGTYPMLGYSPTDLKCSVTSCIIPAYWPHVVVSNMPVYGDVVSIEGFYRLVLSSLPQGYLVLRHPSLQSVFQEMVKLLVLQRNGLLYTREAMELVTK